MSHTSSSTDTERLAPSLNVDAPGLGYPVQGSKVQPPILRDDTLARPRLLDWLHAKIHSRLVLITAEAGYGKTTLLADFTRRTRLRVLWYRLDDTDRGWAPFIAHLVAAGRRTDPGFAPATSNLLQELDPAGPSRDEVMGVLLRELGAISTSGAAIVLDDYHLVDDADEVVALVKELIVRAPERVTIVIASRRRPSLPVARLRTLGEVAELTGTDLRFDEAETDQLFREAYGCPLDRDTVAELTRRTEGWVASLHLVQAAIRGRTARETRSFIRSLTGAEGTLYDYLAEEVVGQLPIPLQRFIMRASLLESVEPELAAVVADVDISQARDLIATAERFGLLGRSVVDSRTIHRFHPLVRAFLAARLLREDGASRVASRHRAVAVFAEPFAWSVSCAHYQAAGEGEQVNRVLAAALSGVMATGQYNLASRFVRTEPPDATSELILSRVSLARDDPDDAVRHARAAVELSGTNDRALGNLVAILVGTSGFDEARSLATRLSLTATESQVRSTSALTIGLIDASVDGDLRELLKAAMGLADRSKEFGWKRYEGIALLNAGELLRCMGDTRGVLEIAARAQEVLHAADSAIDLATIASLRCWALAREGDLSQARRELQETRGYARGSALIETLSEFALTEALYGDSHSGASLLDEAEVIGAGRSLEHSEKVALVRAQLALRRGRASEARSILAGVRPRAYSGVPGRETWRLSLDAHLLALEGDPKAPAAVKSALEHARNQGADGWAAYCTALLVSLRPPDEFSQGMTALAEQDPGALCSIAELLAVRLDDLDEAGLGAIRREVLLRPVRWLQVLRDEVEHSRPRFAAGRLLQAIGEREDVARLRRLGRLAHAGSADRNLGRQLARNLAPRVFVEDQGRVVVKIGAEPFSGRSIRRKVLALLCFLIAKPAFTAARDEILDSLWPDMDPSDALNSLNQTLYFLRRVFEPSYSEDLSPGYVHHDSEMVWLDPDLVDSRSAQFARLLDTVSRPPSPSQVEEVATAYRGKFALDFAYEDWSSAHRDTQHAAYLQIIEEGLRADAESGQFQRGVDTARTAMAIDPTAHSIEHALLRLYKLGGSHAAAGEQYSHYAAQLKADLDIDAPALDLI